jgi:hypothetical protein
MMVLGLLCALGISWGMIGDTTAGSGRAPVADSAGGQAGVSLTIATGPDTALVFIDSVQRGTTPLTVDSLAAGNHIIRLVHADVPSWLTGTILDTVHCGPGERRTLRYSFERRVLIITDPSGALVFAGDSSLGTTPMVFALPPGGIPGGLSASKQGYERMVIPLPPGQGGITRAVLKKLWQSDPPEGALVRESNGDRSSIRLYVAGGITVVAGIAAAYFKIKADNRNAAYQANGSPALRDETRRLDTAAGISLIATQIGFGFLTYFLLAD